jgi:hypothetical protein
VITREWPLLPAVLAIGLITNRTIVLRLDALAFASSRSYLVLIFDR